jgi:hypothetical protein
VSRSSEPSQARPSVWAMPSLALQEWQGTRSVQLDELDAAHGAVGGTGPGRSASWRTRP